MEQTAVVTTVTDISLVTLQGCPADVAYLAKILDMIAQEGVNIDMISMAPAQGTLSALSITIQDMDLGELLPFIPKINKTSGIKTIISSGNSKITVTDPRMKSTPGIAAKIFRAAAAVNTDIRIVTTSEDEVSILVTPADFEETLKSIRAAVC